ncbi:hypothetical protein LOD99_6372 [Oopsacas minuta]|uniref:Uncharacterized protein n=1 Tax=Oopsacas minuta TaxID=111878 RepID=A0AAV7JM71_9METZ|nr:hypothetical protein LOD99_6372 [Oopsacas minuta]
MSKRGKKVFKGCDTIWRHVFKQIHITEVYEINITVLQDILDIILYQHSIGLSVCFMKSCDSRMKILYSISSGPGFWSISPDK